VSSGAGEQLKEEEACVSALVFAKTRWRKNAKRGKVRKSDEFRQILNETLF
jgi:hypothetical protein